MGKPVVVLDVDDVLIDLSGAWCGWLNHEYKTTVLSSDITDWDFASFFPELTREQVFEPLSKPEFWDTVEAKEGAVEELEKMCGEFDVWLCTSSRIDTAALKYDHTLSRLFPFLGWRRVIVSSNKAMMRCDYIVDDKPGNLSDNPAQKMLVTMPHNRTFDAGKNGMFRVHGLRDVYDYICELERVKLLSYAEYLVCDKIARRTKMDAWFCIQQTDGGVDNVYDLEGDSLVPLRLGIMWLAEGVEDSGVYDLLGLSHEEDETFRSLVARAGVEFSVR